MARAAVRADEEIEVGRDRDRRKQRGGSPLLVWNEAPSRGDPAESVAYGRRHFGMAFNPRNVPSIRMPPDAGEPVGRVSAPFDTKRAEMKRLVLAAVMLTVFADLGSAQDARGFLGAAVSSSVNREWYAAVGGGMTIDLGTPFRDRANRYGFRMTVEDYLTRYETYSAPPVTRSSVVTGHQIAIRGAMLF
jgi:hypothetical protein